MDVLADLLSRAHARGAVFAVSTLHAPFGLEFRDFTPLSIHAVLERELYVVVDGAPPVRAMQGDLFLVHTDGPYQLLSAPDQPARPFMECTVQPDPTSSEVEHPGPGPATRLVCGAYSFDGMLCESLLAALPPVIRLPAGQDPALRNALGLFVDELGRSDPGQQTVLDRLLDLLLVFSLRAWFARRDSAEPAWFHALDDPAAGPALQAIHADPAHPWTVASLAATAGLSRAAFARRFTAATGQAPLAYLTAWRMGLAATELTRPGTTIADVAASVGYANEFAFAAAFKRHHKEPPGRYRARQRLTA